MEKDGGSATLAGHRATFAPPPPTKRTPNQAVIDAVERAGLRGRGGAGFPTAAKFRTVAAGRGRPVVLANGGEGEPASRKDAHLMSLAPHLVIDGVLLAAAAVGADKAILAVKIGNGTSRRVMARALAERYQSERNTLEIRIVDVPNRYLAGEERALVNLVNGGPATPPAGNSRPFEKGIGGRPTLVQNVETLCHLALINRSGPEWFRSAGTSDLPGTTLITLGGAVARGGVYEVDTGTAFSDVLNSAGGATQEIGAVLIGGYSGAWLSAEEAARIHLDHASLASAGGVLGSGAIVVLPATSCGIGETAATMRWMAAQTAGQCGPCVFGLASIADASRELRDGTADSRVLARLLRWADEIEGRGACRYPDGALRMMRSALKTFGVDAREHSQGHPCMNAGRPLILPLPEARSAA